MPKKLVVVESPAKAKTINKYLGKDYEVVASMGHIRDLPPKRIGVDIENHFAPEYVQLPDKKKIIDGLRKSAHGCDQILLASDPDREGEAIAWHIQEVLKKEKKEILRIVFNEITKTAILQAVENPHHVNLSLVDAQQARRVLDRLVGYKVSPVLWRTVRGAMSAGRVQSVALRLICEREEEIEAFNPEEYWSIEVEFAHDPNFRAKLHAFENKKIKLGDEAAAQKMVVYLREQAFEVDKIQNKKKKKNPQAPFITSTLQQEAAKILHFPSSKTMQVAQQLYEGIELGSEGATGLITYMRTDSVRTSKEAVAEVREVIGNLFGLQDVPAKPNTFKAKQAQDAHECIRPTSSMRRPQDVKSFLTNDQYKLYSLIWKRFLASQMKAAVYDSKTIFVMAGQAELRATSSSLVEKGYLQAYEYVEEKDREEEQLFPSLQKGERLQMHEIFPKQHFTEPPAHFNEASLIKILEALGIGRPSTYAAIIYTLLKRKYVQKEKRTLLPTELGKEVNRLLVSYFSDVFNVEFTAKMEDSLDAIAAGETPWVQVVDSFFDPLKKQLDSLDFKEIRKSLEQETDIRCDQCQSPMVIKWGKNGRFLACSNFPDCRNTANFKINEDGQIEVIKQEPQIQETELKCERCGHPMVIRNGRNGEFLACSNYPKCKNTKSFTRDESGQLLVEKEEISDEKCPQCGHPLVLKKSRAGARFWACSHYPKCRFSKPYFTGVPCPEDGCSGEIVERTGKRGKFYGCSLYPKCKFVSANEVLQVTCPECGHGFAVKKFSVDQGEYLECLQCKTKINP